jgi:hypothetical protein
LPVCVAGLALTGAAVAHHSPAAFDQTNEVVVEGVVAAVAWRNPHIYLTLETATPEGGANLQEVEIGPVASLQPLGLTREVLVVGERISVRAAPNRRGPGRTVMGLDMTRPDGSIYPLHVSGRRTLPPLPPEAGSLAGSWAPLPDDFMRLFREMVPALPVTEATREAMADRTSLRAAEATCVAYPMPMLSLISVQRSIEIEDSRVTIRYDWMDAGQVIHLDQTGHPPDVEPSLLGHSIGHWEGNTLVVDTVAFTPHRQGIAHGVPSTAAKHTIERLTLGTDRRHIDYQITVEDSGALTEPYTIGTRWDYRPDLEPSDEPCDPEVASRFMEDY